MEIFEQFYSALPTLLPALAVIAAVLLALWIAHWLLLRRKRGLGEERRFPGRIVMLLATGFGIVIILLALPLSPSTRNQLFSLLGLLLTAVIALSSTTFVANAMAGMMLRAVRSFRPGDFVKVGDQFGRVTDRGLFHAEIQTEDRDLITVPNLYLVSHPITVVRASGTIVSANVSLGYNNPHPLVESLLIESAKAADLEEPFVQVVDLGDYSITYRVAGFLQEVKQLLTARSNLRKMMLDTLHGAGVEIVSPTFMNQRPVREESKTVPPESYLQSVRSAATTDQIPEERIFDKAEEVEKLETLRSERESLTAEIKELETLVKEADTADRDEIEKEIERRRIQVDTITQTIENAEKHKEN